MRDEEQGMRVLARAAVLGLAGLTAFGAAGCNRGGGSGGATTIIQQAPPANSGATTSSSVASSVKPIDDPSRLCVTLKGRGQEVIHAIDSFSELIPKAGSGESWSWDDEKIIAAADKVKEVVEKDGKFLEASIGSRAPRDIADAVRGFVKASRDFADGVNSRLDAPELNPLNHAFTDAVNQDKEACRF